MKTLKECFRESGGFRLQRELKTQRGYGGTRRARARVEREDDRRADREGSEWKIVILRVAFVNAAGGLVRFGLSGVPGPEGEGETGGS